MYDEPTPEELDQIAALEEAELVRAHGLRVWDAETAEWVREDPYEYPFWDVVAAGWDDPADAVRVLERTVIADHRLLGLADTPVGGSTVHSIDEALADEPERALRVVPIDEVLADEPTLEERLLDGALALIFHRNSGWGFDPAQEEVKAA